MSDIAVEVGDGFEDGVEEEPNIVRIGKKPIMNYVVACMTLLNNGVGEVMVRGRGQSITKAVETVDMLKRAFMKNIKVHSVDIGTEEIKRDDGSIASLSMIEIMLGNWPPSRRSGSSDIISSRLIGLAAIQICRLRSISILRLL